MHAPEGEILLIDKPYRWTSFDVVKKVKRFYRDGRVGHAGTLDPLATGLLVVCTGKKTKLIAGIQDAVKEYEGTFRLGQTTSSFDLETQVDAEFDTAHLTDEILFRAARSFLGEINQVPPLHSAVKIDGQRAYKIARRGDTAVINPRPVSIFEFELTAISLPDVDFRVVCSKGTYIRSLARDFGQRVDSGAYLSRLIRTRIGTYRLADAMHPDQLEQYFSKESVRS